MATLVVGIALAYIAGRLLAPDPISPDVDTSAPTFSKRGAYAPLVLGRRAVGPVIGWVGNRSVEKKSAGGKGGGGGKSKVNIYSEEAWHIWCVGPVHQIHGIYQKDKNLLSQAYTRDNLAEGVLVSAGKDSQVSFVWGMCEQSAVAAPSPDDRVGVKSSWPGLAYAFWDDRNLGQTPVWPDIKYDIEVRIPEAWTPITGGAAWLSGTVPGGPALQQVSEGVNPAHALWYVLTAPFPFGCAVPANLLDLGAFDELASLCETEHTPINIMAHSGQEALTAIADVLQDVGIQLPSYRGIVSPVLVRPYDGVETLPDIPETLVQRGPPEIEISREATKLERVVYQFADRRNRFAVQDIASADDGSETVRLSRREKTVAMPSVTEFPVASKAAERRHLEATVGGQSISLRVARAPARIVGGQLFTYKGKRYRCISRTPDLVIDGATIEAVPDIYQQDADALSEPERFSVASDDTPLADLFLWLETPRELNPADSPTLFLARTPDNQFVRGALTHVSDQDAGYVGIGQATSGSVGGFLEDPLLAADGDVTQGPVLELFGGSDPTDVLDLSSSVAQWEAGVQLLIMGQEIMFLQSITAVGEGRYRLDGIKRSKYGTVAQNHRNGDTAIIVQVTDLEYQTSPLITKDQSLFVKTLPFSLEDADDLSNSELETRDARGVSTAPLPGSGFSANSDTDRYSSGGNAVLNWTATETGQSENIPLGEFRIEILKADGTVVRTLSEATPVVGANSLTYTNANMVTDFGSEPDKFRARLYAVNTEETGKSEFSEIEVLKGNIPFGFSLDIPRNHDTFDGRVDHLSDLLIAESFSGV